MPLLSRVESSKIWFSAIAALAFLSGIAALLWPPLSAVIGFVATAAALYRLRHWPAAATRLSDSDRQASPPPERAASVSGPPALAPVRPLSSAPPPSDELGGYERLQKIAEGNMGELWLVRHRELNRMATLKEIKGGEVAADDLERFNREAQALSRLCCPHTIQIYVFGVGSEGYPYYVMEHLDGVDLQTLVSRHGAMLPERVVHVLRQVCLSLEEAHAAGLVHRDIKPANIMLCHYGAMWDFAKLLDFGLVKADKSSGRASLTSAAVVLGTPAYLAPESLKGSKFVDARADLYGLGAVAFYMLTGRLLFDHDNPVKMAKAHLQEPAPRVSQYARFSLPRELDDLLEACLRKNPDERPQTAGEMRARLEAIPLATPWTQEHAEKWWAAAAG